MYILMDYKTTCEVCGKPINGVVARHVQDNDSALLGNIINDFADSVDATNARIGLKKQVEAKEWDTLNFSNGATRHCCPSCGAHQSWEKLPEPVEPKVPGSDKKGGILTTVIMGVIGGIVGMVAGLFLMIFAGTIALIIASVIGIVLGIVLGRWVGKAEDKDYEESYPAAVEEYNRYVKEYNDHMESLKTRGVRYEPEVSIESARVSRATDEATEAVWQGLRRSL